MIFSKIKIAVIIPVIRVLIRKLLAACFVIALYTHWARSVVVILLTQKPALRIAAIACALIEKNAIPISANKQRFW